jgi:hypothetical protein
MGADESRVGGRVSVNRHREAQGNLFGGHDEVRVRKNGTCRVLATRSEGPKQLTLEGGIEFANTKRNPWNEQREADDARKGLTAR